jgi:putative membrane protein
MKGLALLLLLVPAPALAHAGESHGGWTLSPWVTGPLLVSALLYAAGFARLWRRSDQGRPALRRGALLFAAGWLVLAAAVVSPLHEAGEASFAMHMIEHELIMLPAALLLVASRPGRGAPSPESRAAAGACGAFSPTRWSPPWCS